MINRTKIASLAVCAILSAAVLTGCGGSSASSSTASSAAPAASSQAASSVVSSAAAEENGASDLDGIYNALLQADPISNQFEIAAMNIEYDFGLQAEDVVSYKGVNCQPADRLPAGPGGFLRQLRRVCPGTEQRGKRHHLLQGRPCGHGDRLQRVHRRPEQCCGQRPEQLNLTF